MITKMVKLIGGMLILASSLHAMTLSGGTNIVKATSDITLSSSSLGGNILKIYGVNSAGGYIGYDPSVASFLNSLTSIESGKNYIVILNDDVDTTDFSNGSNITESCVELISGTNIIQLPVLSLSSSLNGADILKIYGVNSAGGYIGYDPSVASFLNSLTASEDGKSYIVITSSTSTGTCDTNTTIEQPPETPSLDDYETTELSAPPSVPSI